MTPVKLIPVGDSAALVLPEEMLARLNWRLGDTVILKERPNGYSLTMPQQDDDASNQEG
jgi:antitoxin component of MazEF toxin-antitoxin module